MELKKVPHINEPDYDALWSVCSELDVPLCFHAGASAKIQMSAGEIFTPAAAQAFGAIVRSVSSIAVLANFLFSRVLYRFPQLKVVFAEGSLGWIAYELEYADYQSAADGLQSEGFTLKPSELFQRQCFVTCWYDRQSLRVRKYPSSGNILWSSKFPLATSTWPTTRARLDAALADIPDAEKQRICWKNAAQLYKL
jgi:predicted TIM-barrel fold metal-dependent hydrolase